MSFALSMDGGRLEWGSHSLDTIFAQRSNLASPSFLRCAQGAGLRVCMQVLAAAGGTGDGDAWLCSGTQHLCRCCRCWGFAA